MTPANEASKQAASGFVTRLTPQAKTATYDALEAAFQFDAEAIYLLTDGAPGGGRVDGVEDIVAAIGKANRTRRKSIYTIGVGVGEAGNKFEWFLRTLAEQNYGAFRRVDQ